MRFRGTRGSTTTGFGDEVAVYTTVEDLARLEPEWNLLAHDAGSPFLTVQWLTAWWRAFGSGAFECLALRDAAGVLRAGGCFGRTHDELVGTANYHSGGWDVVARDREARAELYTRVAAESSHALVLPAMYKGETVTLAQAALAGAGYRTVREPGIQSPYRELPGSYEELLASVSHDLRWQLKRRRRCLEEEGALELRTIRGGDDLESELDAVFRVEGSGWKTAARTAILSDLHTSRFYRELAYQAAAKGWLRLHLLELGGIAIAADFALVYAGGEFLLKTGFDERYARRSPGLVLRAEVLRSAIEEGIGFYDFLGGPDAHKLRWTQQIRPRVTLRAYRGPAYFPRFAYRSRVRPVLKALSTWLTAQGIDVVRAMPSKPW